MHNRTKNHERERIEIGNPEIIDGINGHWWRQPDGALKPGYELGHACPRLSMLEAMTLVIDTDIPAPVSRAAQLRALKVGQSVLLPSVSERVASAQASQEKRRALKARQKKRFLVRTVAGGSRVWRVE